MNKESRLDERRQKACESCIKWAYDLALAHCRRWGCLLEIEEAAGEAMLALGKASLNFDFDAGTRLTTYATPVVRRHLIHWSLYRLKKCREHFGQFGDEEGSYPEPTDHRGRRPHSRHADDLDALLALADRLDAEALRLRAICGMKWREVGEALGCSGREARARSERALAVLRGLAG